MSGGGMSGGYEGGAAPSLLLSVRWQSAQPVREAMVVVKYGREKATSDEAKQFLNQQVPSYIVGILGLPAEVARMPADRLTELAKSGTALLRKDKDPIPAEAAQAASREKLADLYFLFPKTSPITIDDKEVEFVSKVGRFEVKRKFKLKDMQIGDKLDL